MLHPTVFNTSQLCYQLGVRHVVLSPGSRNAPLTISFARNESIKKYIIPDERSAAFFALGIAQETKTPVALCCTSGTALLNYAPAIAEAYYRQIPLLVLSADRPPELIDQRDGQTIRQFEALKNHVKQTYQLVDIKSHVDEVTYEQDLMNAIHQTTQLPAGPVHVNIPFSEPFYPDRNQILAFKENTADKASSIELPKVELDLSSHQKVLILVGQQDYNATLDQALSKIQERIPVIKSPLNNITSGVEFVDAFIGKQEELKPDLLITAGLSVLSKKLKQFMRAHKPARHLHFDPAGVAVDTYQTKPELIKGQLLDYIQYFDINVDDRYVEQWRRYSHKAKSAIDQFLSTAPFSEAKASQSVLSGIPENTKLHLSNSMPVRYADLLGVPENVQVFANRGTSGIDGCTSTAAGSSLVTDELNVLITGDLAFLYDRNAFFHNYRIPNLRIVVMNNGGGGIFRLIDGPSKLAELEEYFETRHNRSAEYICMENGLEYLRVTDSDELENAFRTFYEPSENVKIMEIFTEPEVNQKVYKDLRNYIHERINH